MVALSDVPDPVFGKGIMGPGGDPAIGYQRRMRQDRAWSSGPVSGHAFGLLDNGVEVLIHIGPTP